MAKISIQKEKVCISIDRKILARLNEIARRKGMSRSSILEYFAELYLSNEPTYIKSELEKAVKMARYWKEMAIAHNCLVDIQE